MITLTLSVPAIADVLAAGWDKIEVRKSSDQTPTGTYTTPYSPLITLVADTTSYSFTDVDGSDADWYITLFLRSGVGNYSQPSAPQPGYLSTVLEGARTLIGVTTNEASDSDMLNPALFPAALAAVRARLSVQTLGLDATMAAGGDRATLAVAALTYYLAARLCQRMKIQIVDYERIKDYIYQRNKALDWDAFADALMAQYETLIGLAGGETADDEVVYTTPAVLSGATRQGYNTGGDLTPLAPNWTLGSQVQGR